MPKTVKIEWSKPADIVTGTKLDKQQLCATACDNNGAEVPGEFAYDPRPGTELAPGEHELRVVFHPKDGSAYKKAAHSTSITVVATAAASSSSGYGSGAAAGSKGGPSAVLPVKVTGAVKFGRDGALLPIAGACVTLNDLDCRISTEKKTDVDGCYAFDATLGSNVSIEFPTAASFSGHTVALLDSQLVYFRPCKDIDLPVTRYVSSGCKISGQAVRADSTGLAGATITLHQADADGDTAIAETTTLADGRFSIVTEQTGRLQVSFEVFETDEQRLLPSRDDFDVFVDAECPTDICLPPVTYSAVTAQLCGIVNDADNRSLKGIDVELRSADGARTLERACTNANGLWIFSELQPGRYQVRFPLAIPSKSLELVGDDPTQTFDLKAGDAKLAATVTYQPEPHVIEQMVLIGDQPAEGILVDVRKPGAHFALQAARTVNGLVSFVLDEEGTYEVRIYQDPEAKAGALIKQVEVHSKSRSIARIAPPAPIGPLAGGLSTGTGTAVPPPSAGGTITDLAYPVLTEEIGYPPSPLARSGGMASSGAAMPALGQVATKAISDVLGWQLKSDPKAFLGALNASFALKEVGGHTEATWTPRTYAVQTDLSGGITGAQASVYKRAKDALEQSLPLLDGLYPLFEEAKPEDISALRATVRSQFTDLVNELGLLGGPRIARVTQLFFLLLGQQLPQKSSDVSNFQKGNLGGPLQTDPDQISGSLGNLRQELGLSIAADQVNTVEDEQDVTNFRIVCDYVTSLAQSWLNNLQFFGLQTATPFFGTQLVLLSRQLSVLAEKTNEVRFTLDSVFIGPADRQTLQIPFPSPDPPMFLEDLLTWIDGFASEEGPRLIAEGGKFAVGQSFVPIAQQLQRLVNGLITVQQSGTLPPGFTTTRVGNALKDLADSLQQLVSLATPVSHVITPEPQSPLAVLGIAPNTIAANANSSFLLTIMGTGFDIGGGVTQTAIQSPIVKITLDGAQIFSNTPAIASGNLLYVALSVSAAAAKPGSHQISITVTNRNNQSASLVTDLFAL
jgi:hypothetical protein